MTRLIFLFVFLICNLTNYAQVIDHSVEVYATYGVPISIGKEIIVDNNFALPSFYNNFNRRQSLTLGTSYKVRPHLSLGLEYNQLNLSEWSKENTEIFNGATTSISTLGPVLIIHPAFNEKRANRIKIYAQFSPVLAFSKNTFITKNLTGAEESEQDLIQSQLMSYGFRITPGLNISLSQTIDLTLKSTINYSTVKGSIINDTSLLFLSNELGLVFKLFKDKRFYLGE